MTTVEAGGQLIFDVICPGCGEVLKMAAAQDDGPVSHVWQSRTRMVNWTGHDCPVLGPMPDPMDAPALLKWTTGALKGLLEKKPKSQSKDSLTVVADNSKVEQETLPQKTQRKPRTLVHIPYDKIECPALADCHVAGRVPGVKRHVGFMHPDLVDSTVFPPNRTVDGLINNFEEDEQAAERLIDALGIRSELPENASWEDVAERVLKIAGDK